MNKAIKRTVHSLTVSSLALAMLGLGMCQSEAAE